MSVARSRARSFHRGAVQALAPEEPQVTPRLAALVRHELIRPDAQVPGDDGFRFRHLLIRDAAYGALPKAARAELHERLGPVAGGARLRPRRAGRDPRLSLRAGLPLQARARVPAAEALTARARGRLANAGRRALTRRDYGAAVNLFERAALSPPATASTSLSRWTWRKRCSSPGRLEDALQFAAAVAESAARAGERNG